MLEETKKSLLASPIVKKGDYDYFVNGISDGIPAMDPVIFKELTDVIKKHIDLLEEYKQSLIYHVVTGKVDVREVEV